MFILLGYLVVALAILGGAIGISPRIQQLMSRWRARKPMPMTDWSNDVEETSVNMVRLLMETAEVDVHWAWLMQNAPPEYQDKLILAWDRLHQTEPALLLHAKKLGRYKPEYGFKAMAACLDDVASYSANACPHSRGQASLEQALLPLPPALPQHVSAPPASTSLPPAPPSAEEELRSYGARMAAAVASGWAAGEHVPAEPASGSTTIRSPPSVVPEPTGVAPAGPTAPRKRHSFMVFEGGRVLPAKTGND